MINSSNVARRPQTAHESEQGPLRALLIHIVRLFEMDFEIEKCAKFIWRRGKVTACMELNHQRD